MPYDRILDLASPPGAPGIYLLGTYAKRLTLYSQQTRAINLVDAIHWYRRPLRDATIAVVGAGVAGVTAAAHAVDLGARVTLIERLEGILGIQRLSARWLHPTLYDWPFSALDPQEEKTALPVMNWSAGTAKDVANALATEWAARYDKTVTSHFNAQVKEVVTSADGVTLRWHHKTKDIDQREEGVFHHVIFAVGFGLESKGPRHGGYWENDALDQLQRQEDHVLIGGYGDGALTDLMRACLDTFDHQELLTSVVRAVDEDTLSRIRSIESDDRASDAAFLTAEYKALVVEPVQRLLKPRVRATRRVVLTAPGPHLFAPRASALNRLVASQLFHLGAFRHEPIEEHERITTADAGDPVFMKVQGRAGGAFTDVVLRIGVERTIDKIEGLPGLDTLRRRWEPIQPRTDPTRVPLWDRFTPISEDIDHSAVLFLAPSSDETLLSDVLHRAVKEVKSELVRDLRIVHVTECLRSNEALLHAVRALCRCPVAVFALGPEMGRQNIGGMLLMGIRAAVRRGVTIVIHEGRLDTADWSKLPFNLKELHIYSIDTSQQQDVKAAFGSAVLVATGIREGLAVLSSDAQGYRDMPVFDIVRRPIRRTANPLGREREVFVLCSFDESYGKSWQRLTTWLHDEADNMGGKLSLKRVLDYASPLLVGERLYELTRHAGTCLIDWTGWSPNVFFEMGVRLAVASSRPVCILREDQLPADDSTDGSARLLVDRFQPIQYLRPNKHDPAFGEQLLAAFLARSDHRQQDTDGIYAAVERHITLDDEYGGSPLHEQLFESVQAMLGRNTANLTLLYGRNPGLRRQVLQSAADSLIAARLLIEHKRRSAADAVGDGSLIEMHDQIESLLAEVQDLLQDES